MEIKFKKINDKAILPTRQHNTDAGYDLYHTSGKEVWIDSHTTKMLGTGWAIAIPEGMFGAIFARSGISTRKSLRPANCVGVIDSGYRGEIQIALHNDSDKPMIVQAKERIAQLIILPFAPFTINEVDKLDDTDRSDGGFGSTGE